MMLATSVPNMAVPGDNTRRIFGSYDGRHVIEEDEPHGNNENAVHVTPTQLLSIGKYFNEISV